MPPEEPEDLVEDHTGDRGGQDDCDERRPVFGPEHLNGGVLRVLHREDDHDDRHRTPTINATLISRAPVDSGEALDRLSFGTPCNREPILQSGEHPYRRLLAPGGDGGGLHVATSCSISERVERP